MKKSSNKNLKTFLKILTIIITVALVIFLLFCLKRGFFSSPEVIVKRVEKFGFFGPVIFISIKWAAATEQKYLSVWVLKDLVNMREHWDTTSIQELNWTVKKTDWSPQRPGNAWIRENHGRLVIPILHPWVRDMWLRLRFRFLVPL